MFVVNKSAFLAEKVGNFVDFSLKTCKFKSKSVKIFDLVVFGNKWFSSKTTTPTW